MKSFFTLLMFFLLTITAHAAKIYTWTDENGEKHFSQTPPSNHENIDYKKKEIKTSKPSISKKNNNQALKKNDAMHDKSMASSNDDKNILRHGETGKLKDLISKKNPDKLLLIYTPNVNTIIAKEEKRKGRLLTANELEKIRSEAVVKAVNQEEAIKYQ